MNRTSCFATPFYVGNINADLNSLVDYAYNLKETSKGRIMTNINGWQSDELDTTNSLLLPIISEFERWCNIFHKDLKLKEKYSQKISDIWFNINSKGSSNSPHIHHLNVFSGVFYLKANKNSGELVFTHPAINHVYHFNSDTVDEWTESNSGVLNITPEEGKLVLFPSYASHYVKSNTTDNDRISLAFNTKFIDYDDTNLQ